MVRIKVNIKCLAILNDRHNQYIFKDNFFQNLGNIPVLKILVQPSEDLMSPNYSTLSVVQQMQREGCNVYIIFLSNANQIIRLLTFGDRHRLLNSRANFVMMFDKRLFQSNLHYLWKKIINIVFIHKYEGSNQFELYSSIFPIQNLGQLTTPPLVDIWRSGKFIQNGQKIFVDKISDLNKNSLNVVTFQHIPSVIEKGEYSNDCTANKNILRFGGVEIEILKCLSEALHFLPRVYEVGSDIKWGKRQPNGSFSGLIGELLNGKADIALGNLYHSPYYLELIDLSIPYHTECLTFITPESRTDSSWKTLVLPFKFNMWAGILISLLLAGFIFHVLAKFHRHLERNNYNPSISKINYQGLKPKLIGICRKIYLKTNTEIQLTIDTEVQSCQYNKNINKIFCVTQSQHEGLYQFEEIENSILYTYSMLLLVSLPKLPTGWALRLMTGWWWYYCLLVVVSYRASMTAILANPAPRVTIDTLQELAASPIHCGGWNDADKEFFTTSIDSDGRKVGLKFEIVNSIEASIAKVAAGSYAYYENIYFLQHERIKYLLHNNRSVPSGKNGDNIADDRLLHIMSDCIIKMPVSIGLQKNSPLKPKTDYVLQRIIETGLIKKWLNDVMFNTVAAESSFIFEEIKAFMDLKKLYGGLVALAIGYVISNLLLVFELIHWYYFVQKHPLFDKYSLTTYYQRS